VNDNFPFGKFFNQTYLNKDNDNNKLDRYLPRKSKKNEPVQDMEHLKQQMLDKLKQEVSSDIYNTYFKDTFVLKNFQDNNIRVEVNSPFLKDSLEKKYAPLIKNSLEKLLATQLQVNIVGPSISRQKKSKKTARDMTFNLTPTQEDLEAQVNSAYFEHVRPDDDRMIIDPTKTFSNFIVGSSNNVAAAAGKAI
jgi:chromosomal replication initiation ATPase DnaA